MAGEGLYKASPFGSLVIQLVGVAVVLIAYTGGAPVAGLYNAVLDTQMLKWFSDKYLGGVEPSEAFHQLVCFFVLANMSMAMVALLAGVQAAYGRYSNSSWGPLVPNRLSWVVQELPVCAWGFWALMRADFDPLQKKTATVVGAMILIHYINRTFIFPFRLRAGKPIPLTLVILACIFCCCNGYIQFKYLVSFSDYDDANYEYFSPRFVLGTFIFFFGMGVNLHSDTILMKLRRPGDTGYYIPRGGFFTLVSGANFFGEVIEWLGFAIAANSLPAWTFAIGTFCNIVPRAIHHHAWYKKKFDNYPPERKAVIPFVW